ncbi:cysteine methyltransferase [Candidatus Fermentibacteria bacterium]|nr:cysteine methyltransferase [Candidatus Fermentibacteria bacterium]
MSPSGLYERIHRLVRRIPPGKVTTYGQIAAMLGDCTPRQVGYAMHSVGPDDLVPWHRVVNSKGKISVRANGERSPEQRAMLESEGVEFDTEGRIDLEKFCWVVPGNLPGPPTRIWRRSEAPKG